MMTGCQSVMRPVGEVHRRVVPSSSHYLLKAQDFYALAERGLRDDSPDSVYNIPSPARAAGHHRDRVRIDIVTHGTLEISNMDTFGGNVLKLAAVQEFTKSIDVETATVGKIRTNGRIIKQFPELFPPEVTKETLRTAHLNSISGKTRCGRRITNSKWWKRNCLSPIFSIIAL